MTKRDAENVLRAREGIAVPLRAGEALRITNLEGGQVVDTWVLAQSDPGEYVSMEHTRVALGRLIPRAGDGLYSNHRRPLLTLTEDTSPGVHDTLIAACDPERYRQLGAEAGHASCAENFRAALVTLGIQTDHVPAPLNLFMNIAWDEPGSTRVSRLSGAGGRLRDARGRGRRDRRPVGVPDGPEPDQRRRPARRRVGRPRGVVGAQPPERAARRASVIMLSISKMALAANRAVTWPAPS